ncbi:MAG: tetratricopeptide repeat protein [Balneolaceae bacterium]
MFFIIIPAFVSVSGASDIVAGLQNDLNVDELVEKALKKMEEAEEYASMDLFEKVLTIDADNYEALWNLSLLYSKKGHRLEDRGAMMEDYERARDLAELCLEYYPEQADCHYVYAVAIGRIADISGTRRRVHASEEIKDHIDRTLELEPDHKGGWHLLGVWHASVANLSRAERWTASLIFGGLPGGASNSKAEESLKKAIELYPDNILFHLDLARFYREVGRTGDAIKVLEKTLGLEVKDMDDPANLERAKSMLEDLR